MPTFKRPYAPAYNRTQNLTKSKRKFNRVADLVESNPRSQSLELIMQHPQGSSSERGNKADRRALENEIVVIQQIDQTSRERLGSRGEETFSVDTNAGT